MSAATESVQAEWDARMIALSKLRDLETCPDYEAAHGAADEALCVLLRKLGHEAVVEAWERVPKWYA